MIMQPGGYTGALFARSGAWILAACLVSVCGVAYLPVEFVVTTSPANVPRRLSCLRGASVHTATSDCDPGSRPGAIDYRQPYR
jgi:hypothetical protein